MAFFVGNDLLDRLNLKHYGRCQEVGYSWRKKEVIWMSRSSWILWKEIRNSSGSICYGAGGSSICGGIRGGVALVECCRRFCSNEKHLISTIVKKISFSEMDLRLGCFPVVGGHLRIRKSKVLSTQHGVFFSSLSFYRLKKKKKKEGSGTGKRAWVTQPSV